MHTKIELDRLGMKPKFSEFIKTESDGSDKEAEEQEPVAKIIQKLTTNAAISQSLLTQTQRTQTMITRKNKL